MAFLLLSSGTAIGHSLKLASGIGSAQCKEQRSPQVVISKCSRSASPLVNILNGPAICVHADSG